MNGRATYQSERPKASHDITELISLCDQLGDQLYSLALHEVFKENRENFNTKIKFNVSTYDHLIAIIAKYGDTSTNIKDVNQKLRQNIKECMQSGILHLPSDRAERDLITRIIGNYSQLQLRIAQLHYFYTNDTLQHNTYNREQSLLALLKIRKILPKIIECAAKAGTKKNSFTFFNIAIPEVYQGKTSQLHATYKHLETECERLMTCINETTQSNPKNITPIATIAPNAFKSPSKRKAKKRIISDADMCEYPENIILAKEKKQAFNPTPFVDNDEKTILISAILKEDGILSKEKKQIFTPTPLIDNEDKLTFISPILEYTINSRAEQLQCKDHENNLFSKLHDVTTENKKMIDAERTQRALPTQTHMKSQPASDHHKAGNFLQSLKVKFTRLVDFLINIVCTMASLTLDQFLPTSDNIKNQSDDKLTHQRQQSSATKSTLFLARHGGKDACNAPPILIAKVLKDTIARDAARNDHIQAIDDIDQQRPKMRA